LKTAVVILNFNGIQFLKTFLGSVVLHSKGAQIYVVDNASNDHSVAYISTEFPSVQIIEHPKNLGFAGGYNEALKHIEAKYYVLLNSDVELSANWLDPLESLADSNPTIAAIQPKILDYNTKNRFEYAGAAGGQLDILGYPFCRGRLFDTLEEDQGQYNTRQQIFWASGACLFIRAQVFKEMDGFDDRFFAHMEEIDLCWRIQNQGHTIYYEPNSAVFHVGGGTLHKSNPLKTFLNYRNNLAMLFKNLPTAWLFPILFLRLLLDGVSAAKFLKEGKWKDIFAILKAHFAFYAMLPYLLKHRSPHFLGFKKLYKSAIVWEYFINKKHKYSDL
jgi:GT2 family glycosyltransferase